MVNAPSFGADAADGITSPDASRSIQNVRKPSRRSCIVFPILYAVIIWFQTKRGFGNLQKFQTHILYAFSADGYKVSDAKSSSDIDWATILRAAESKHSFHLFFHRSLFHTIPKRCFDQPEKIAQLRSLLKQSLGDKASVL
jgi:hypothetical protein